MKNFVLMPNQTVFTGSSVKTVLVVLFSLIANWTFSQTTTYSASTTSWTSSPTANASCSGTLLANTIKHRVSISGRTANFEVAKVSGTFSSAGTVYIKDASCGNVLTQANFSKGVSSVSISVNLSHTSGSRNYVATLNSNTGDKFYTNPLSITATTTQPATSLSASPTNLSFASNGGTQSITISSNANWIVSGAVQGFTISAVSSNRINVVASSNENPNATTQNRGGSFNIVAGSGANSKTVSIALSQAGKVVVSQTTLSASPTNLSFASNGGTQSITVSSNANWVVSGAVQGFTISAVASNRINVVASSNENPNATTQNRGGSFNIVAGSGANSKTVSIALSQAGKVVVSQITLSASPTSLSFASNGGTQSITVSSNANWVVSGSVPGFTISAVASNRINVVASSNENPNATTQNRGGSFNIIAGSGANVKTVSIALSQAGKVYTPPSLGGFKVIGYLPTYQLGAISKIDFKKLSHVNLSFVNPSYDDKLKIQKWSFDDNETSITKSYIQQNIKNKNSNIKIFLALGGYLGSGGFYFSNVGTNDQKNRAKKFYDDWVLLLGNDTYRKNAIQFILDKVNTLGLDGVDLDLEWKTTKISQYDTFVKELAIAISNAKKEFTVTLEATTHDVKYPTSFSNVSWINLMTYDDGNPHASMATYGSNYNYWINKGILSSKIVMGLPFYGYANGSQVPYSDIVSKNTSNAYKDNAIINNNDCNYNGITTIQTKTRLAKVGGKVATTNISMQSCGGVMIWELGQDSFDNYSLLSAIYSSATSNARIGVEETVNQVEVSNFYVYPNPTNNSDWIDFNKEVSYQILDEKTSQVVMSSDENVKGCNISKLSSGRYIIRTNEGQVFRLVK